MEFADPPLVVNPAGSDGASAVVIWLHGLGADGHDFQPIVPQLRAVNAHTRFVFPNAPMIPVTINQGYVMRAWYDIAMATEASSTPSPTGGALISDAVGIRASAAYLDSLVEQEHKAGIPYERIVVAGFSQGGAIAQFAALRFGHRLAGLMALSTYLPMAEELTAERSKANASIPIFLAHGAYDPMIPLSRAEASRGALEAMDYQVEWHSYPMEHAVSPQEIADIDGWLGRVIP